MHKFLVKNKIESYLSLDNIKAAFFVVMLKNYKKKPKQMHFYLFKWTMLHEVYRDLK